MSPKSTFSTYTICYHREWHCWQKPHIYDNLMIQTEIIWLSLRDKTFLCREEFTISVTGLSVSNCTWWKTMRLHFLSLYSKRNLVFMQENNSLKETANQHIKFRSIFLAGCYSCLLCTLLLKFSEAYQVNYHGCSSTAWSFDGLLDWSVKHLTASSTSRLLVFVFRWLAFSSPDYWIELNVYMRTSRRLFYW